MSGLSESEREVLEVAAIAVNGYFPDDSITPPAETGGASDV